MSEWCERTSKQTSEWPSTTRFLVVLNHGEGGTLSPFISTCLGLCADAVDEGTHARAKGTRVRGGGTRAPKTETEVIYQILSYQKRIEIWLNDLKSLLNTEKRVDAFTK